MPSVVEDRNELKLQIEAMERDAEKEKDDVSRKMQDAKTEAATMQENMQEKVRTEGKLLLS